MNKAAKFAALLVSLIAASGIYPVMGVVTEVDRTADTVTFTNTNGHSFSFVGCEDWASNDLVSAIMWNNGTPWDVTDDVILSARYQGIPEDLPDAFPHRWEFERDFARDFPGQSCDLYGIKELTAHTLESRIDWEWYVVEVSTGTVLDKEGNGRADIDPPYNYISYAGLGFEAGTRVVTYCVYELHSGGVDDIIARYDYRLSR